jgi:hypothetical protein
MRYRGRRGIAGIGRVLRMVTVARAGHALYEDG